MKLIPERGHVSWSQSNTLSRHHRHWRDRAQNCHGTEPQIRVFVGRTVVPGLDNHAPGQYQRGTAEFSLARARKPRTKSARESVRDSLQFCGPLGSDMKTAVKVRLGVRIRDRRAGQGRAVTELIKPRVENTIMRHPLCFHRSYFEREERYR